MPPPPVDLGGTVEQLAVGHDHSCVLLGSGNVRCSGRGLTFGSLGYASTDNVGDDPGEMPPPDVDIGGKAVQVFASGISFSTCALLEDQTLRCWGYNKFGQLGYGDTNHIGADETPASAGPVPY